MGINIITLNGHSPVINYIALEEQIKASLAKTCSEATICVLNNFPIATSSDVKTDIVISFCIKKLSGNYYRRLKGQDQLYFYNFLMPIRVCRNFSNSNIREDSNRYVLIDEVPYNYDNDVQALKLGFRNYLINRCGYLKSDITVFPLIFIEHQSYSFCRDSIIIAPVIDWNHILESILQFSNSHIISVRSWNSPLGYNNYLTSLETLNERASEDSAFGYLTKRKIERLSQIVSKFYVGRSKKRVKEDKFDNSLFDVSVIENLKVKDSLESNSLMDDTLIIIEGKAGTGKTTELLNLMARQLEQGRNARFMTYNHLLVHDITNMYKSYSNVRHKSNESDSIPGSVSVMTLHLFFFRLSRSLGILHLMTEARMNELKELLAKRMNRVIIETQKQISNFDGDIFAGNIYNRVKELLLNSVNLNHPEKEVAVDFINYLMRNNFSLTIDVKVSAIKFLNFKKTFLENICVNNVFLIDYYEVLKNTISALIDTSAFFDKFNIESKYELLYAVMNYEKHYKNNQDLESGLIPREIYIQRVNKVVAGHRLGGAVVLLDEAQDCHFYERDILFMVFNPNNIAIASGGKEQLIRHVDLCKWTTFNKKPIPHRLFSTGKKSYRLKRNLLNLCNYLAKEFHVQLDLEPLDSDDVGELIIDCRSNLSEENAKDVFSTLLLKGSVNKCLPYESLLVLLNPTHANMSEITNSNQASENILSETRHNVVINEYGNIEEQALSRELEFKFSKPLGEVCQFWDGTDDNIRKSSIPAYGEVRMIYYQSCRGLEAWSVACFDIDLFFTKKLNEPDAEKYMTDTIFKLEDRKNMYAATWSLMALTRAIDTMYIKIADSNSILGNVIINYAKTHPSVCKLIL